MEPKIVIPSREAVVKPLRPIREKKVRTHGTTKVLRKQYAFEETHM